MTAEHSPDPNNGDSPSLALIHDYLLTMRGAERSFREIARAWPTAPIFTSLYDVSAVGDDFRGHEINTSFLQHLGIRQGSFRKWLPVFPAVFPRFDLADFDVIVSSSSAFAHGIRPRADAKHLCYCYSPFRYAWHERERALSEVPTAAQPVLNQFLDWVKQRDIEASSRVTRYVAISQLTRERISESYGRDSSVIYPPVDTERFGSPSSPEDYFLFVGEVVRHKRIEVALQAAETAGARIKVVGSGPDQAVLEKRFGSVVEFVGRISDAELNDLYARAVALIVPNVEEFGIAAVESMAAGRPVVAIDEGGTSETVIHGQTGVLVPNGSVDEFAAAISDTHFSDFSPADCQRQADNFSTEAFRSAIRAEVDLMLADSSTA